MLHANQKELFTKTLNKLNGKAVEVVVVAVSNQLIKVKTKKFRKRSLVINQLSVIMSNFSKK